MTDASVVNHDLYQQWLDDGFIHIKRFFSEETCQALCTVLDAHSNHACFTKTGFGLIGQNVWRELPMFQSTLKNSGLISIAKTLLKTHEVCLFQDLIIWKPPLSEREVSWHQDYSYWPLSSPNGVTIWIALDPAPIDSGCLQYLPGSQKKGECQPTVYTLDNSYSHESGLPAMPIDELSNTIRTVPCALGDALIHHPLCCHMSTVNASLQPRRAWSITLLSSDVCWMPRHAPHPLNHQIKLVEGSALPIDRFPRY